MELSAARRAPALLDGADAAVLEAVAAGLPRVSRPYAAIGAALGVSEAQVIAALRRLIDTGVIRRFGLIVRHRALGYTANAMVVFDVPDRALARIAPRLAACEWVTLCYRRPRRPPHWPYNLFCMIHGRDRATVRAQIERLVADCALDGIPRAVLFSTRCFKQEGARYRAAPPLEAVS